MESAEKQGFIFSLDAFIAFTLIMVTVGMLLFIIGAPKSFYPSLEQAHQLAQDTLQVLATSSDGAAGSPTYLEQLMSGESAKPIMFKVAGGSAEYPGIIPAGFGYRLEKYNFKTGGWDADPLYDSGKDCAESHGLPPSDRCGKEFTKIRASATTFASIYSSPPNPGKSPYCYLSCFGYPTEHNNEHPCDAAPCNVSKWNFDSGANSIQLVRLTVYA